MAADDIITLSPDTYAYLMRAAELLNSLRVTGAATFTRSPTSLTIHVPPVRVPRAAAPRPDGAWYVIDGSERDGDNWRWSYAVRPLGGKTAQKWDGWEPSDGSADPLSGYNTAEFAAPGGGVDLGALPEGWELQPVPDGTPVRGWRVPVDGQDEPEVWFTFANAVNPAGIAEVTVVTGVVWDETGTGVLSQNTLQVTVLATGDTDTTDITEGEECEDEGESEL